MGHPRPGQAAVTSSTTSFCPVTYDRSPAWFTQQSLARYCRPPILKYKGLEYGRNKWKISKRIMDLEQVSNLNTGLEFWHGPFSRLGRCSGSWRRQLPVSSRAWDHACFFTVMVRATHRYQEKKKRKRKEVRVG